MFECVALRSVMPGIVLTWFVTGFRTVEIDSFSFAVPLEPALGKAHWLMRQKVEKTEVSPLFPLFFHAYTTLLA